MNTASPAPTVRRRGFLVVEALMYMALLLMFSTLAYQVYHRAKQQSADIHRQSRQISLAMRAGERWRADVRQATVAPEWIPSAWHKAVVMRLTTPTGNIDYFFEGSRVWRKAGDAPKEKILFNVKSSEMVDDPHGAIPAVRWELELKTQGGRRARTRPLFTFLAVPNSQSLQ